MLDFSGRSFMFYNNNPLKKCPYHSPYEFFLLFFGYN